MSTADIIFNRRNPILKQHEFIWGLIYNSYNGGIDYQNGKYLFKYPKESDESFKVRKERAVYFNQIQPLADIISGFLFMTEPKRENA